MKTTIRTILCAAAVVLAAVSCQKSVEPVQTAEEGKGTIDICVSGLMGEYTQQDGVKSSLVNNVRVAWAAGDVVYVFDGSNYLGKLTAALDKKADGLTDEDRYAKLGGTISAPATTPCVLSLVHSTLMTEPTAGAAVSELSIDMSAQSTATVPFVAYATMDYTGESISDVVVPFQFATSVIKVNCTGLKPGTVITSATLSNVNTECKLTLSGDGAPTVSGVTNGIITRTGDEYFAATNVNSEGEAVFQIAVPKLEIASGARVLTVAQSSDEVKDKKFTTKSLNPATSVNTVCQLVGLPAGALKGEFSVGSNATDKVHFSQGNLYAKKTGDNWTWDFYNEQYKYNSLSTGSSRTANANDTEIDLFTWGYANTSNNSYSLNPVNTAGISGHTIGGETFSSLEDWGYVFGGQSSVWRTLTLAEWKYLFNTRSNASSLYKYGVTVCGKANCVVLLPDDWTWDANTVGTDWQTDGYPETQTSNEVTWEKMEKAGAVCLPAAGGRSDSHVGNVGAVGYYWSSTAYDSDYAYLVGFDSSTFVPDYDNNRSLGCSVRLITESN